MHLVLGPEHDTWHKAGAEKLGIALASNAEIWCGQPLSTVATGMSLVTDCCPVPDCQKCPGF